jgi:hemoglobin/transferrin/lactoferrin receptor protein
MVWIDPELVKQVDVIRGPVANTYGSGAIGGVVFFETKDAVDFLRPGETWGASVTGRYDTNGHGWTTSATGAYKFNDTADILGNIVWRDFGDYKDGDGDEVAGSGFDVLSGMLKSTIRPTDTSELKLGWVGANDSWTEGSNAYDLDVKQNTFTARYNISDEDQSWLDLHINAAYNKADLDQTYRRNVRRFSSITGLPITVPAGSQTTYDLDTYASTSGTRHVSIRALYRTN